MRKKILVSRRSFIKAATVGSAPFILPSRIWSAETGPNSRINLGFIGMGTQNRGLMGSFIRRSQVQVVAVCEVDTVRREDAKRRADEHYAKQNDSGYKGCAAYNEFRQLLERWQTGADGGATLSK